MKSIYDYINESILDDMGDLMNQTDNTVSKGWFDEYATGNFKVKVLKSGTTKVTGDVIIRGYDGETFPVINIDEFTGSLKIEKCPNLVSTEGLFKDYFYQLRGDLVISNCPKLVKLSCPVSVEGNFHLIGNSSLKSLEGAPELVNGEVYVMKNGKKFKEEQIKQHIKYIGDFICCSEDEIEADVNESEELNEALNNSYLLLLAKQLKNNKKSFKDIFGSYSIAWDQVDSSHIQNYNWRFKKPSEKDLKAARLIISGKVTGFIITYHYGGDDNKIVFDNVINYNKIVRNLHSSSANYWVSYKSTEIIDMIIGGYYNRTDGMIIISGLEYGSELSTHKKEGDRRISRDGMVENTPEYYRKVAQKNLERYKKIIETNKANRNSGEVAKVQKMVESFLKDVMQASQNMLKNPSKYVADRFYLERLNSVAYDKISYGRNGSYGKDGVLVLFNKYMENWADAVAGQVYYHTSTDEAMKSLQKQIELRIQDAQVYLNKFDV